MTGTVLLRTLVFATCLAQASFAGAEIYKWRDAEGNLHFSDEEPSDGAERIELKPLPIMNFPMPEKIGATQQREEPTTGYEVLTVTRPANDARLRDVDGKINVSASLEPDLQKGHRLQVWVDGAEAGPAEPKTSLVAENVSGGEHRLKVVVVDEDGQAVQSSAEVRFFLLQNTPDR